MPFCMKPIKKYPDTHITVYPYKTVNTNSHTIDLKEKKSRDKKKYLLLITPSANSKILQRCCVGGAVPPAPAPAAPGSESPRSEDSKGSRSSRLSNPEFAAKHKGNRQ